MILGSDEMTARTNFAHPGCYARALKDCSKTISREHYVSTAVSELLGDEHRITNASWLSPGQESAGIPTSALGSKILCERHNCALSALDAQAKAFFTELVWGLSDSPPRVRHRHVTVDGDRLELWLLKACCGALASGNLVERGCTIVRQPPREWLDLLFCGRRWENGAGLHIRQATLTPHRGYTIGPAYLADTWIGGGFEFVGVELFVLLSDAEKRILEQSTGEMSALIHRPGAIKIESRKRTAEITLHWQAWVAREGVRYVHARCAK